jgi:DNA-binding response OmpR family regulator/HPt (histidine-containing phosphotransfer) domain-containing protein
MATPPSSSVDVLQLVLDETRQRFVESFVDRCVAMRALVEQAAGARVSASGAALMQAAHRLNGLAGTIGFPTVSARAAELERLVDAGDAGMFDVPAVDAAIEAIASAFENDRASLSLGREGQPAPPLEPVAAVAPGAKILVAEDDADQLAIVSTCLRDAGWVAAGVAAGNEVMARARAEKPAVILLDVAMPGLDGYSVCRLLKEDPELASIPVIFMTTQAGLHDRLAGLSLGADEFLTKPIDMRELVLRIQIVLRRTPSAPSTPVSVIRTIIIAEDDPEVVRILDAQVRAAGYAAVITGDGEEALAAVRERAADVLVLDLMLPRVNGFDVLSQLQSAAGPKPRIIVLSGRGREQDVVRAFELGADDYMTKPFNPQELIARIARLMK